MTGTRALRRTAATAVAVLAVLVGVPWALWALAGLPWPGQVTSLADLAARLSQPIGDPLALQLLALIGWACWAAFAATVARETLWYLARLPHLRRDQTLHTTHLDALPALRFLIAACIGTLILTFLSWARPLPVTAHPVHPVAHTAAPTTRPTPVSGPAHEARPHQAPTGQRQAEGPHASSRGPVLYTVRPGDTLWDIAKQRLGDPIRWPEIYALSQHLAQPGGEHLTDPDVLRPGWQLRLPAHDPAPAPPRHHRQADPSPHTPELTPAPQPEPEPEPAPTADQPDHHAETAHPTTDKPTIDTQPRTRELPGSKDGSAVEEEPTTPPSSLSSRPVQVPIGVASVIGVTTAAGIAAAVALARAHARRRRTPDQATPPPRLTTAARAARRAALAARRASHDQDEDPDITRRPAPADPAPPGTVTIAHQHGTELPLEALATPGGWNLTGPGARPAARALALAILTAASRLAPNPPHVRLILPGPLAGRLLPRLATATLPGVTTTTDNDSALRLAHASTIERARARENIPLSPDSPHPHPQPRPQPRPRPRPRPMDVVLLDTLSTPQDVALACLAAPGELAILTLDGDALACTAELANDGTVIHTAGAHGPGLDGAGFFTLTIGPADELLDCLIAAHPTDTPIGDAAAENAATKGAAGGASDGPGDAPVVVPPPGGPPAPPTPPEQKSEHSENAAPPRTPTARSSPPGPVPSAAQASPPLTVRLFGGMSLHAPKGEFPLSLKGPSREFLALLAANPQGILTDTIIDAMGVSTDPEQATKSLVNLRRAVRRTLRQATGSTSAAVVLQAAGRHRLDPTLATSDVAAFTTALAHAARASGDDERAAALRQALDHYAGPLCEGADYLWADELREHFRHKAIDAAIHLTDHHLQQRQSQQAIALLERAAAWEPANEPIAQRLMRLHHDHGHPEAAAHVYQRLLRQLAEIDATPAPATRALAHGPATASRPPELREQPQRPRQTPMAYR